MAGPALLCCPTPSQLLERAQGALARGLLGLPRPAVRLLAGGEPTRIDGQELDPEVQLLLRLMALSGGLQLETMTPEAAREAIGSTTRALGGEPAAVAHVDPHAIPGPAGEIPARLYRPYGGTVARPLVVYFHGGGWVLGDLDTHDGLCRFLAVWAGVNVLAVDYRLAPEQRFPAAVDDALAAFRWAAGHADALVSDPQRVGVAGDSAGGNLAAVVARLAVREGGPRPAHQLLIYPVTDLASKHPSYRLFGNGFFLTEAHMDWYRDHYLPDEASRRDPRVSPLLAEDLSGLAPACVVTAGFDPLRDEGEGYARRLEEAGVAVVRQRHEGMIHGFANSTGLLASARRAMEQVATALKEGLG